ncbi:MAG TPA: FHA domain-containing protein, partial [Bacteroidota bacterium]
MAVRIRLAKTGEQVETRELLLPQDLVSIGRDAASILPLADPLVSKAHARIERNGGSYSITDLHSTNATYLNGEKLTPDRPYSLTPGDKVKIAGFELELLAADAPARHLSGGPAPATGGLPSGLERAPGTNGQFSRYLEEWFVLRSQVVKDLENFDLRKIAASHDQLLQRCEELAEENQKLRDRLLKEPAPGPVEAPSRPATPPPSS